MRTASWVVLDAAGVANGAHDRGQNPHKTDRDSVSRDHE
jgi:hypothetical protein